MAPLYPELGQACPAQIGRDVRTRGDRPVGRSPALSPPGPLFESGGLLSQQSMPASVPALAGFTVVVATDVCRHELAARLEAEGARTIGIRAVRTVPQPDPDAIAAAVESSVAEPIHEVIVSSAFGLRTWLAAVRRAGRLEDLLRGFAEARLLARDARAADELRELGFTQIWSTAAGTTEDLFRYLFAQPAIGRRVVAHLDTDAERERCEHLRQRGAIVVEVSTTHPVHPPHVGVLQRQCDLIARHQVDAVAFVGPATTAHLIDQAERDGVLDDVLNAFAKPVAAVGLGPLTAAPLRARAVPVLTPSSPGTEAMAALLVETLSRRGIVVQAGGRRLEIRGQAVVLGDRLVPIQSGPLSVLRVLAVYPGEVMSAADILCALPRPYTVDVHSGRTRDRNGRLSPAQLTGA